MPGSLGQRLIEQVKIPVDILDYRLQAPRANHLNLGFQVPRYPDLSIQQLRGRGNFQGFYLPYFTGSVIDASGSIALPDAHFADGKVLDVEEHISSASGAYAHAFPLFRHLRFKSRKPRVYAPRSPRIGYRVFLVLEAWQDPRNRLNGEIRGFKASVPERGQ